MFVNFSNIVYTVFYMRLPEKQHILSHDPLHIDLEVGMIEVYENHLIKNSNQGTVVRGLNTETKQPVVIKISHPFTVGEKESPAPDDHTHILREIHILPQLSRIEGIPRFLGAKHIIQGAIERYFLVEEKVNGIDFEERRKQDPSRRLTTDEAIDMLLQCAPILLAAHTLGIMHRDLKLSNFMVEKSGKIWIVDWGTAKEIAEAHDGITGSTPENSVIGTVQFMSPEQITGKRLDARTDIYTLGAVVALLRYGPAVSQRYTVDEKEEVHERSKKEIATAIAAKETIKYERFPHPDSEKERLLQKILRNMTNPERGNRYQSMQEVIDEIKNSRVV